MPPVFAHDQMICVEVIQAQLPSQPTRYRRETSTQHRRLEAQPLQSLHKIRATMIQSDPRFERFPHCARGTVQKGTSLSQGSLEVKLPIHSCCRDGRDLCLYSQLPSNLINDFLLYE